jgi:ferric-dicitrate binding protein FerR (iron transport regulator)
MGREHKKYAWNLIAKKLAGDASPEELIALESLLRNNPELHYPMQTVADLWHHTSRLDKAQAEKAFNDHVERMADLKIDYAPAPADPIRDDFYTDKKRNYRRAAYFLAPAITLSIFLTWFFNRSPKIPIIPAATASTALPASTGSAISTANGSRTHLSLPDGSKVWVNAGSRIDYGKNFGGALREVTLTGEAFFDVAPDAGRPFIVHTKGLDIRVLGTSFNVKSYPTDRTTEATLIRGSIEVSIRNRPKDKIILHPNEKIVVSNDTNLSSATPEPRRPITADQSLLVIRKPTLYEHTGPMIETSWVDNKLIFQEEEFNDLARRMERWYGVTIHFDNPRLGKLQFTGIFEKETIQQALEAMRLAEQFNYSVEGSEITIHD